MQSIEHTTQEVPTSSFLNREIFSNFRLNWEILLFALILILAIASRFYNVDARVMSHDETSHTYFSWLLYKGQGYAHDPVTHGPLQFHLVALSLFLFGDSDFSTHIPAVIFSIAAVAFMWKYRRYLGQAGALAAALLLVISPFMMYYGRYVRNEAFVAFFGVAMFWAMLRYFETGQNRYLYWLTTVNILHFTAKETAFIYTAQALLFLALYLIYRVTQRQWIKSENRSRFLLLLILALALVTTGAALWVLQSSINTTPPDAIPSLQPATTTASPGAIPIILVILGVLSLAGSLYFLFDGFTLARIREERAFDMAILIGTLVLPMLTPFAMKALGWKIPINATEVNALQIADLLRMGSIILPITLISIAIGLWWNRRQWLINAAIWYSIFTVLYTTMFTNGAGFFTGLVGSLGYWMSQQAVNRGGQPWYYYSLIQIPIYEYLPALGSLIAGIILLLRRRSPLSGLSPIQVEAQYSNGNEPPTLALLGTWAITSLIAYTIAGEKMPWITVHIALPMILLAAWVIGYLIDTADWSVFRDRKGWLVIALLFVFFPALFAVLGSLLGDNPPFAGKSLEQLAATSTFLISLFAAIASAIGLFYIVKEWAPKQVRRIFTLAFLALLGILTARTAITASLINYDLATEYLVYAHCAPGIKIALSQIEELSKRTTGGLDMVVAYDNDTTYPYWWYLRNYTNQRYYGGNPTRDLRDAPAILVGDSNFGKIEPIVGQAYYEFDYIRIWWPNQDYYNLTWDRILNAFRDPIMRAAIFQIWLNRDFTKYGQVVGRDMSLQNWSPSGRMRLYLRKDIVAQIWDYGTSPSPESIIADPYEGKSRTLNADRTFGSPGTDPGQFQNPRDIAVAPDGSLYIADTNNHRIQHLTPDGTLLQQWGTFADVAKGAAPGGTFYEPWGVAVGLDGSVYVADTWNHRIQKFTKDGEFITMWGYFGQAETPFALWGPRDIAIDSLGMVYVTDTGNKRVVIYSPDGEYINQFGSVGFEPGQFNEPVGIAIDSGGLIYIADTWNQRVQVISPDGSGNFSTLRSWEVVAWYGESLDNKPYIAVGNDGSVYVTDPEGYRVLKFNNQGQFLYYWGEYGAGPSNFGMPNGITVDAENGLWVADSGNHRVMHFIPPKE
jgi:predicted membrane-bound mannosyltransferase/DNA-binding beta-propeller fold protein YncE